MCHMLQNGVEWLYSKRDIILEKTHIFYLRLEYPTSDHHSARGTYQRHAPASASVSPCTMLMVRLEYAWFLHYGGRSERGGEEERG